MATGGAPARAATGRRGRRRGLLLFALVAAWLAGKGLLALAEMPSEPAESAGPEAGRAAAPAAPHAESAASVPAAAAPAPAVELAPDRFASLVSALEAHLAAAELAEAFAAAHHLAGLPLGPAQRQQVDRARTRVAALAAARTDAVVAALRAGRARTAADLFAPLRRAADDPTSAAVVAPLLDAAALSPWRASVVAADAALPAPRPLPRGRAVHFGPAGDGRRGVVVAATAVDVTVRSEHDGRVAFPTIAYAECEPDEPSPAEAVELALAAARVGEARLAGGWLLVAALRGDGGSPRLGSVLAALR